MEQTRIFFSNQFVFRLVVRIWRRTDVCPMSINCSIRSSSVSIWIHFPFMMEGKKVGTILFTSHEFGNRRTRIGNRHLVQGCKNSCGIRWSPLPIRRPRCGDGQWSFRRARTWRYESISGLCGMRHFQEMDFHTVEKNCLRCWQTEVGNRSDKVPGSWAVSNLPKSFTISSSPPTSNSYLHCLSLLFFAAAPAVRNCARFQFRCRWCPAIPIQVEGPWFRK